MNAMFVQPSSNNDWEEKEAICVCWVVQWDSNQVINSLMDDLTILTFSN